MPDRLAAALLLTANVAADRVLSELQRDERLRLVEVLVRGALPWTSDEGYRKAEVTGGGVSLAEIDPRTMESRRCAGLYLCGEVLDAFGPIGGYNFLWAWARSRRSPSSSSKPGEPITPKIDTVRSTASWRLVAGADNSAPSASCVA